MYSFFYCDGDFHFVRANDAEGTVLFSTPYKDKAYNVLERINGGYGVCETLAMTGGFYITWHGMMDIKECINAKERIHGSYYS